MKKNVGINGFGRFGLHLLKYWLDRSDKANFRISYINDDYLNIDDAFKIIVNDKNVIFNKYKIQLSGNFLIILEPNGSKHEIQYTNCSSELVTWIGKPDIFFECSGKYTVASKNSIFLKKNTKLVIISATSWDADKTIVYGYNHQNYKDDLKVISYGSCTVNAYLPLAKWIDNNYGIANSDVSVIHNIQEYRLHENNTLNRKFCTLEKSAALLMDCINSDNFTVNYTIVPYAGVSLIDFRFNLKNIVSKQQIIRDFENSINHGDLHGLYGLNEIDVGPEVHNCTTFSTVFIREGVRVLGDNLYLQGYFDNENSVNRYYDLADYVCNSI